MWGGVRGAGTVTLPPLRRPPWRWLRRSRRGGGRWRRATAPPFPPARRARPGARGAGGGAGPAEGGAAQEGEVGRAPAGADAAGVLAQRHVQAVVRHLDAPVPACLGQQLSRAHPPRADARASLTLGP